MGIYTKQEEAQHYCGFLITCLGGGLASLGSGLAILGSGSAGHGDT